MAKKLLKNGKMAESAILIFFFAISSAFLIFTWSPEIPGASFDVLHDYIWKIIIFVKFVVYF